MWERGGGLLLLSLWTVNINTDFSALTLNSNQFCLLIILFAFSQLGFLFLFVHMPCSHEGRKCHFLSQTPVAQTLSFKITLKCFQTVAKKQLTSVPPCILWIYGQKSASVSYPDLGFSRFKLHFSVVKCMEFFNGVCDQLGSLKQKSPCQS